MMDVVEVARVVGFSENFYRSDWLYGSRTTLDREETLETRRVNERIVWDAARQF